MVHLLNMEVVGNWDVIFKRRNEVGSLFRFFPVDLRKQIKKIPKDPCTNEKV